MWLRQSTANQEIKLGGFLDSTDGNTQETALTIANTDIFLTKGGATTEVNKNSGGATHVANGRYTATLDATDTDTLGILEVDVHVTGALPVHRSYLIVPANVHDSIVAGTDTLQSDVTQWLGTAVAAPSIAGVPEVDATHVSGTVQTANDNGADIKIMVAGIIDGTCSGTPTTTTTNTDITGFAADQITGRTLTFTGGAAEGEQTEITDFVVTNGILTYNELNGVAPGGTDTFKIT